MSMPSGPPEEDRSSAAETDGGSGTITGALDKATSDDDGTLSEVIELTYDELSTLARSYLRKERRNHTLDTRALVHEAYARLVGQPGVQWQNRRHFFGIAAQHMRRILCDYARRHQAEKRGGGQRPIYLHALDDVASEDEGTVWIDDVLTLDQVLDQLGRHDMEALEIVHLRCILGFKMAEISREMGIPTRSLSRKWRWIRAWLITELRVQESQPPL